MKPITSECLSAAGITRVVWIDDFFAPPTRDELVDAVYVFIRKLKDQGHSPIDIPQFEEIDLTRPWSELEDDVSEILEQMSEQDVNKVANSFAKLCGMPAPGVKSLPDDFSPEDFAALQLAFGEGLTTFSLGGWTSAGALQFQSASEDTLFLIDKEYKREQGGVDGIDILADLVKRTRAFCIMLTHLWAEAEQEDRRVNVASEKGLEPYRFCILSKRQSPDLPIDLRFARAIRTIMTHRFNGEIAFTVGKTIRESTEKTANALANQSVSDIERALFENADKEGVLEYDAVLRIFEIEQRHALNEILANAKIQNPLRASRKFRKGIAKLNIPIAGSDMAFFRGWRKREVFFEGVALNKLHAPLSCGDIFKTDAGLLYLLIAQPCDLMIRNSNGTRRAEVGLFVEIVEPQKDDPDQLTPVPNYRFYDLKITPADDKKSFVDFRKLFVVDLFILDFAAFNEKGRVELHSNQSEPSVVLTDGWAHRLKAAKCRIFPKNKSALKPDLGMGKHATKLSGTLDNGHLHYPLCRIGRLHSSLATAILGAWAAFQTRAALDHDFANPPKSTTITIASDPPKKTETGQASTV